MQFSSLPRMTRYARRNNLNGTTDSICERCLQTIATTDEPRELRYFEDTHTCNEQVLRGLLSAENDLSHVRAQLEAVMDFSRRRLRRSAA